MKKGKRNGGIITAYIKKTNNPNMGRPKTVNRTNRLELRLSDSENEQLNKCALILGLTKTDVLVRGIELVYDGLDSGIKKESE